MAREKFEKERDLNIITEYYLKGYTTRAIAKKIYDLSVAGNVKDSKGEIYSISHVVVSKDIKLLLKQWRDDRIHDITSQKIIELTKIDKLEETYWFAWEKSIENHTKVINKAKGTPGANKADSQEITEMNVREFGEPRYLQGVDKCIERRCKLLGLDAPVKLEHQDNSFLSFLMNTD